MIIKDVAATVKTYNLHFQPEFENFRKSEIQWTEGIDKYTINPSEFKWKKQPIIIKLTDPIRDEIMKIEEKPEVPIIKVTIEDILKPA